MLAAVSQGYMVDPQPALSLRGQVGVMEMILVHQGAHATGHRILRGGHGRQARAVAVDTVTVTLAG